MKHTQGPETVQGMSTSNVINMSITGTRQWTDQVQQIRRTKVSGKLQEWSDQQQCATGNTGQTISTQQQQDASDQDDQVHIRPNQINSTLKTRPDKSNDVNSEEHGCRDSSQQMQRPHATISSTWRWHPTIFKQQQYANAHIIEAVKNKLHEGNRK